MTVADSGNGLGKLVQCMHDRRPAMKDGNPISVSVRRITTPKT